MRDCENKRTELMGMDNVDDVDQGTEAWVQAMGTRTLDRFRCERVFREGAKNHTRGACAPRAWTCSTTEMRKKEHAGKMPALPVGRAGVRAGWTRTLERFRHSAFPSML